MKDFKITSVFIMVIFIITMVSGAYAADHDDKLPIEKKQIQISIKETKELNVKVNEEIEISLYSNPTTGYTWMDPRYESEFLILTGSQYIPYPVPEGICGSGGNQIYNFKAIKAGETQILMEYKRPWENCIGELTLYKVKITE